MRLQRGRRPPSPRRYPIFTTTRDRSAAACSLSGPTASTGTPNLNANLLHEVAEALGVDVGAPDLMAYLAAIAAHPAYTARFRSDLVQPGLRVPMTAAASLFVEAVEIGREIIWLHCFGDRFADPDAGRPGGPPRITEGERPIIPAEGAIPARPDSCPDDIDYEATARRLKVGDGFIDNVPPEVWAYEVSGKQVLAQWFSYRRRDRSRPIMGDRRPPSALERIQPKGWLAEYTTELMNVLHVLGRLVALEPRQAALLSHVCDGRLLSAEVLRAHGAFAATATVRHKWEDDQQGSLLKQDDAQEEHGVSVERRNPRARAADLRARNGRGHR